jgi:hypothetical protein
MGGHGKPCPYKAKLLLAIAIRALSNKRSSELLSASQTCFSGAKVIIE